MIEIKPISLPTLTITLLLAAGGSYSAEKKEWAIVLAFFALLSLIIIIILVLKEKVPRIYLTKNEVIDSFKSIYEEAREKGGEILATHIVSLKNTEKVDKSLTILQGAKKRVEWKRLVFMEDAVAEEKWIRGMLAIAGPNLSCTVDYVPDNYLLPGVIWKILPRFNILLYRRGNVHISLLGLGTLDVDDKKFEHPNFAIKTQSKKHQDVLRHYYDSALANSMVRAVTNSSNYPPRLSEQRLKAEIQSAIAVMMHVGLDNQSIIEHIGVFGSSARTLLNTQTPTSPYHDADVDFLVIVQHGKKEVIREKISKAFDSSTIKIIWGDDDTYFYYFREKGIVTLDIELMEKETDFYIKNQLLGLSIFRNYWPLFTRVEKTYRDFVPLPSGQESRSQRMLRVLKDRKGLESLKEGLATMGPNVDPRRIVNHLLKNMSWAIFNNYPEDTNTALENLRDGWSTYFTNTSINDVTELIVTEQKNDAQGMKYIVTNLLDDAIRYCETHRNST